jgi:hypothetical protein
MMARSRPIKKPAKKRGPDLDLATKARFKLFISIRASKDTT